MAKRKWIQEAIKEPGAFSRKARQAGMSTEEYANKVLSKGSRADKKTKAQARLAKTLSKLRKRKRKK